MVPDRFQSGHEIERRPTFGLDLAEPLLGPIPRCEGLDAPPAHRIQLGVAAAQFLRHRHVMLPPVGAGVEAAHRQDHQLPLPHAQPDR